MKKYIDADKLITKLENYANNISASETSIANIVGDIFNIIDSFQQETSKISLEKFTEKMEDWKARFSYSDSIPVKATMAFIARMFYMYPDIAKEWYDSLPKVTQD